MDKIVIAIFHGLGDCINSTTFLKPIMRNFPNCKITWITSTKYAPLTKNNPLIHKTIEVKGNPFAADSLYKELRKKHGTSLLISAPYMHPPAKTNTLLESFKERITSKFGRPRKFEPIMYLDAEEVEKAQSWLSTRKLNKFILMETSYTSHQSDWKKEHTIKALKMLSRKGYKVVLSHRKDKNLNEFNKHCETFCMDLSFRYTPVIYNNSSGFIGVSSGISCVCHTHQCKKDIPHLEFVRGKHWCTELYNKDNKKIIFDLKKLNNEISRAF